MLQWYLESAWCTCDLHSESFWLLLSTAPRLCLQQCGWSPGGSTQLLPLLLWPHYFAKKAMCKLSFCQPQQKIRSPWMSWGSAGGQCILFIFLILVLLDKCRCCSVICMSVSFLFCFCTCRPIPGVWCCCCWSLTVWLWSYIASCLSPPSKHSKLTNIQGTRTIVTWWITSFKKILLSVCYEGVDDRRFLWVDLVTQFLCQFKINIQHIHDTIMWLLNKWWNIVSKEKNNNIEPWNSRF